MSEGPVRIGLLGASRIAVGAILVPAREIAGVEVTAIGAGDPARAADYAARHGILTVVAGYRALVESDVVDLVYNALPPSGHRPWTIAALEAGKHVLCEKPFALDDVEARRMVDTAVARERVLIEAFHYRFHPLFARVLALICAGTIGRVTALHAHFNAAIPYRPGELRHVAELGGGAMMDLGCYPLHWVRTVMGCEPRVVAAHGTPTATGVDRDMRATLEFPGGVRATVTTSMADDLPPGRDALLTVEGDAGRLRAVDPVAPHEGHELQVETADGSWAETVGGRTTYHHQLEHVLDVLRGTAKPLTGGEDAVANMRALREIYARSGIRPRESGAP